MNPKKLYNIPFWSICVSLIAGAFLCTYFTISIEWYVGAIGVFLLSLLLFRKKNSLLFLLISCLLFLSLGGLRYQLSMPKYQKNHLIHQENCDQSKETVFIITKPFRASGKWKNYNALIKQVDEKRATGSILLKVKDTSGLTTFDRTIN